MKLYPVYNVYGVLVGESVSASKAEDLLAIDAFQWDASGKQIQATLVNVGGLLAWADHRLPTASLVPLLKLDN